MSQYQNQQQDSKAECAKGNHQWLGVGMSPTVFRCIGCGETGKLPPPTARQLDDMRNAWRPE